MKAQQVGQRCVFLFVCSMFAYRHGVNRNVEIWVYRVCKVYVRVKLWISLDSIFLR